MTRSRSFGVSSFSLLALAQCVVGAVHDVWWDITYVENVNPDGLFPRRAVGVNGTWPPPPIEVSTNDSLAVHVRNALDKPTGLHHHGMFFNSSSWMDGATGVTECGIPPGGTFEYHIPVDTSGQWGTYWVHGHASGQYVDGLRAPLILHPPVEAHSYDGDFTVILGDWYHKEHPVLLKQFISIANPGGPEPVPEAPLIYFSQNGAYLGPRPGTSSSGSNAGFNENATLPFELGKTYRLRIINTSALAAFYFWIDGHEMRIIEADGTDVRESPIDLLRVSVAQRYSVLVTARNDTTSNWAIHANMDTEMFDIIPAGLNPNATSSITYNQASPLTDIGFVAAYHDVDDLSLVPIEVIPQPTVTKTIDLEVSFDTADDGTNRAMFNQMTWNVPKVPGIFSALSLGENATADAAYGPLSYVIEYGDVVDLVIKNGDLGKHPFHLHGHKFAIVGRTQNYTSEDITLNPPLVEGQSNPIRRDTVDIPSMHSATIRIVADNPGVWLMHCHIEWHLESGLGMQLIEAPLLAQQRNNVPQIMYDNCKALNHPFSGNAAGKMSATDLDGSVVGPFPQKLGWKPKGIVAMAGCVLTALIGMLTVVWYAWGGGQ